MKSASILRGAAFAIAILFPSAHGWAQTLPGGASSLNETHEAWTVACRSPKGAVLCVVSQSQVRKEDRKTLLTVQMTAPDKDGAVSGVMLLPFGLKLSIGVRLAIDKNKPMDALRFGTCLATGCVVPLKFDKETVASIKKGSALTVEAAAYEGGQHVQFTISLKGFSAALDRITKLLDS